MTAASRPGANKQREHIDPRQAVVQYGERRTNKDAELADDYVGATPLAVVMLPLLTAQI